MKRRVAVLNGIYGNLIALEAVLKELNIQNYEEIICLGDIISFGPCPKECLELLKKNKARILLGDSELKCLDRILLKKDEKEHFKWIKNEIGKRNISFLNNCPIFYDGIELNGRHIAFAHYFLDDSASLFRSSSELAKKNKDKYTDKKYLSKYIGKTKDSAYLLSSNTFLVDSVGSSKDSYASYMVIEIDEDKIITKKVRILYEKELLKDLLEKKDYPSKEIAKNELFYLK